MTKGSLMPTRRDFLKTSTLLALAPTVPGFLARTAWAAAPDRDRRVLVVIQLDGGNDGLNTVIPFADPEYAKLRPSLKQNAKRLIKVTDAVGLHPSLTGFGKLLDRGELAVILGVGYPNPSRSHFRSMAVWQTARLDPEEHTGLGWLGRALDGGPPSVGGALGSLLVGDSQPPVALRGRRSVAAALDRPEEFALNPDMAVNAGPAAAGDDLAAFVRRSTLDAYTTADRLVAAGVSANGADYPATALAGRLKLVAQLLKADLGARVYYTVQGGYDTHATQQFTHATLLQELGGAVAAFFADLTAAKLADRVTLLAFSEFGRTIQENGSGGTDHGTAGPVFLAGPGVKAGLVGSTPSLNHLEGGEPVMTTDFRQVYATVLEDWLGLQAATALGGPFDRMPLLRT
jgi:uncharacterized protein (DUF1501 family)